MTAHGFPQNVGVIVVTYQRAQDLLRCLRSLEDQTTPAKEIIVVVRAEDSETLLSLDQVSTRYLQLKKVIVDLPGVVHARNAGLEVSTADLITFLDDDTTAQPTLLSRVLKRFQDDPHLGGLGGRDRCFSNGSFDDRQERTVGKVQWFGRTIGNHHLGFGEIRPVDLLKGANMSYRAEAVADVRFDSRLKGKGAQPAEDYCFSITVKMKGWKLAYDPSLMVHHYARERAEARQYVGVKAITDLPGYSAYVYNELLCTWIALTPTRRAAFVIWVFLVGTGNVPGMLQGLRFTPRLGWQSWRRFLVAQQGIIMILRDMLFARVRTAARSRLSD